MSNHASLDPPTPCRYVPLVGGIGHAPVVTRSQSADPAEPTRRYGVSKRAAPSESVSLLPGQPP